MANKYFVDESAKTRLPEDLALNALLLLEGKLEMSQAVSVQAFATDYCYPMSVVNAWKKQMQQRFGASATGGQAFQRVWRMLLSESGRRVGRGEPNKVDRADQRRPTKNSQGNIHIQGSPPGLL